MFKLIIVLRKFDRNIICWFLKAVNEPFETKPIVNRQLQAPAWMAIPDMYTHAQATTHVVNKRECYRHQSRNTNAVEKEGQRWFITKESFPEIRFKASYSSPLKMFTAILM